MKPTRESLGLNAIDYLEAKEQEIFNDIWDIAKTGTTDDKTRLDALKLLFNKIRPDRTKLDLDVKSQAPYEVLLKNLGKEPDDLK